MMGKFLDKFEEYAIAALVLCIAVCETFNAIVTAAKLPFQGAPEEIAKFLYVYVCFFSFAFCAKKGCNVSVKIISDKYGKNVQNVLSIVRNVIDTLIAAALLYGSFGYMAKVAGNPESVGQVTGMPLAVLGVAAILGTALCLVRCIQVMIKNGKQEAK